MSERPIEHGQIIREETCDGGLGWKQKFQAVEVGQRIFVRQLTAEVCNGCGAENQLSPDPLMALLESLKKAKIQI